MLRAAYAENDRARARRETYGVAKLIVGPGGRLLGAGVAGAGAAELAALFSLALVGPADGIATGAVRRAVPEPCRDRQPARPRRATRATIR